MSISDPLIHGFLDLRRHPPRRAILQTTKIVGVVNVEDESGRFVRVDHPDHPLLLRGCRLVSPYRAGFEDFEYTQVYANPFVVGSVRWYQYDHGNEDARKQKRELKP